MAPFCREPTMPDPKEPAGSEDRTVSKEDGAPSSPDGERIGAYRLEGRLGRGGMGEVFLARDERLGRWVAIKRIRHDSHPAVRERFRREARAAARLNHPAVVQIYDVVEDGSSDAIVMEHAEGRTLARAAGGGAAGAGRRRSVWRARSPTVWPRRTPPGSSIATSRPRT